MEFINSILDSALVIRNNSFRFILDKSHGNRDQHLDKSFILDYWKLYYLYYYFHKYFMIFSDFAFLKSQYFCQFRLWSLTHIAEIKGT